MGSEILEMKDDFSTGTAGCKVTADGFGLGIEMRTLTIKNEEVLGLC